MVNIINNPAEVRQLKLKKHALTVQLDELENRVLYHQLTQDDESDTWDEIIQVSAVLQHVTKQIETLENNG